GESVGEDLGQARMTSPVAGGEPVRVLPLDAGAGPDPSTLGLKEEELRELYRLMVLTRKADLEATALQRQGELAVYPPLIGQEAAQVGSAFALEESDWIFPSYRELGAAVVRGVDRSEERRVGKECRSGRRSLP